MWAWAFDLAAHLLRAQLRRPLGEISVFADGIAAKLARLMACLPPLSHIFALLSAAAGLSVNYAKTLVTNYSDQSKFHLKRRLVEVAGAAQISVARVGIYLGVLIGPEAAGRFWDAAVSKFTHGCALCRSSRAPFRQRLTAYRTHTASVLQYLAQFAELPKVADVVEAATLASSAPSPMHAVSAAALAGIRSLGAPIRFEAVRTVAGAAAWRAALRLEVLDDIHRDLAADADSDDAFLAKRAPPGGREARESALVSSNGSFRSGRISSGRTRPS